MSSKSHSPWHAQAAVGPKAQRGRPKRPPEPVVTTMPAQPVPCRCGRLWANTTTKDAHVWQEHGGQEPQEEQQ